MRQKIVAGNWKMNGLTSQVIQWVKEIREYTGTDNPATFVVMPPAIYLPLMKELLGDSCMFQLGAQNLCFKEQGAFTGELSASMIKEFNCRYVLAGHSERRHYFNENENIVAQKFHQIKDHGMIPILCVGETLTERENKQTEQIIARQLQAVCETAHTAFRDCIVAYEPVWAIGTGKTASPEQVQQIHRFIREWVAEINKDDADRLPLLYGGSVNENNARALFSMPDVDGGLIGGASLNAKQFVEIVKCIN